MGKYSPVDYLDKSLINTSNKAIFLDRDGTIHIDKVRTHKIEDLEYFNDTFKSIKRLYDMGYLIIIVTNQDGIRKGLYDSNTMSIFNRRIIDDFNKHGIKIAAIYYSPYDKDDNHISFKPNPGMFLDAIEDFKLDSNLCYMIGDQKHDSIASKSANIKSVIVRTGIYNKPIDDSIIDDYIIGVVDNLSMAVDLILKK